MFFKTIIIVIASVAFLVAKAELTENQRVLLKKLIRNPTQSRVSIIFSQRTIDSHDNLVVDAVGMRFTNVDQLKEVFNLFTSDTKNLNVENENTFNDSGARSYFIEEIEDAQDLAYTMIWGTPSEAKFNIQCESHGFLNKNITYHVHTNRAVDVHVNRVRKLSLRLQKAIILYARYAYITFQNEQEMLNSIKDALNNMFSNYIWGVIQIHDHNAFNIKSNGFMELSLNSMKILIHRRINPKQV